MVIDASLHCHPLYAEYLVRIVCLRLFTSACGTVLNYINKVKQICIVKSSIHFEEYCSHFLSRVYMRLDGSKLSILSIPNSDFAQSK